MINTKDLFKTAYAVIKQPEIEDLWSVDTVFLDKNQAQAYIDKKNKSYNEQVELGKICEKCHTDDDTYVLAAECPRCELKEDRHGKYCENEANPYYNLPYHYYIEECPINGNNDEKEKIIFE